MRAAKMLLGLALVFTLVLVVRADDKEGQKKTIKGTITCGKCDLKLVGKCHTVIKKDDTVYWFDPDGNKKYHKKICTSAMEGEVTGVVTEKDGKKFIKVEKLKFNE